MEVGTVKYKFPSPRCCQRNRIRILSRKAGDKPSAVLRFGGSAVSGAYFLQNSDTGYFISGGNNINFDRGDLANTQL